MDKVKKMDTSNVAKCYIGEKGHVGIVLRL
jgi:hypothetical protein